MVTSESGDTVLNLYVFVDSEEMDKLQKMTEKHIS